MKSFGHALHHTTRPRVTVAALVEQAGRFLVVEERDERGSLVINQPAGHLEAGESLLEAYLRELLEETGWEVEPEHLIGVYLWNRPDRDLSYLRFAISGRPLAHHPDRPLDEGIQQALWLTRDELLERQALHRSELVLRCIDDYLAGERYPLCLLKSLLD